MHLITLRHTTRSRSPLDEGSASRRDLCLITHNTHKTETSVPPCAVPASELLQTNSLADIRIGRKKFMTLIFIFFTQYNTLAQLLGYWHQQQRNLGLICSKTCYFPFHKVQIRSVVSRHCVPRVKGLGWRLVSRLRLVPIVNSLSVGLHGLARD